VGDSGALILTVAALTSHCCAMGPSLFGKSQCDF
jgi:hypothetical protein